MLEKRVVVVAVVAMVVALVVVVVVLAFISLHYPTALATVRVMDDRFLKGSDG